MQTLEKAIAINQKHRIPTGLQLLFLISGLLLVWVGFSLFFKLEPVSSRWLWPLPPFSARFSGAVYLTALLPLAIALWHRRWSSARLILPMLTMFTAVVTLVSLFNLNLFAAPRRAVGIWWFLYIADSIGSGYFLWRYWHQIKRTYTLARKPLWTYIRAKGWILLLYGVGLLLLPTVFSGFWPWKLMEFQGRFYSSVFMAGGLGLLWLGRTAIEWVILGITQLSLGSLAIIGTLWVNAQVNKINWSQPGVWLWFALFSELAIAGLWMLWQALHIPMHSSQN
jgi:hypothetical protein